MATTIKPKQKLNIIWDNNQIRRIELNTDSRIYVELSESFYNTTKEQPFNLNEITTTNTNQLKSHMLFIGDLVQECTEQESVVDKLIDIFRDLFWKMHKKVF